jgi:hypothetical protein
MFRTHSHSETSWMTGLTLLAVSLAVFSVAGCERKERVIDVQAPGVDVEVDRNLDTGAVEVNADDR